MAEMIKVGMADLNVCHSPDAITTLGLGSCVGVVLYDKERKIAGMVHVMLPDSTKVRQNQNKAKFADTGIDLLIEMLQKEGAMKSSLTAKIAGGAQMFAFTSNNDMLRVGERNVMMEMGQRDAVFLVLKIEKGSQEPRNVASRSSKSKQMDSP